MCVNNAVRIANSAEIEFENSESPLEKQTRITNFILEMARKITGNDIQTLSELSEYMINQNHQYDYEISKLISESGYLHLWDADKDKNSWRYNYNAMNLSIPVSDKLSLAKKELDSSKEMFERFNKMLDYYDEAHKQYQLEYTKIHKMLYEKLCNAMKQNYLVANDVVKTLSQQGV